jgi:hypothetical protein
MYDQIQYSNCFNDSRLILNINSNTQNGIWNIDHLFSNNSCVNLGAVQSGN